MKILHITPWYKPAFGYGGPIFSIGALCEGLQKSGCRVKVFTTTANGDSELEVSSGVDVIVEGVTVNYFHRWTKDNTNFAPLLLKQLFRKSRSFEVIHINTWWNTVAIFSLLVCILKKIRPLISTHGMLSPYTLRGKKLIFHQLLGNWMLSKAIIHVTTEQERDEILRLNPNWTYVLLPNVSVFPALRHPMMRKPNQGRFRLVFLSRIHHKKGLEYLFEALAQWDYDWALTIFGEGDPDYKKSLEIRALQLGISGSVTWRGWIDGDNKYDQLAAADLFVLPSLNENFAMVVLEALSVGTPVLVSDQVGLKDYVAEKGFGWICKPTATDLRKKIEEACLDQHKRQTIHLKAPEAVRSDFSAAVLVDAYRHTYQKVADGLI